MDDVFKYVLKDYISDEDKKKILSVNTPCEFDIAILLGLIRYDNDYAFRYACKNNQLSIIKFLASKGITNDIGLNIASHYGHLEIVKYLIEISDC